MGCGSSTSATIQAGSERRPGQKEYAANELDDNNISHTNYPRPPKLKKKDLTKDSKLLSKIDIQARKAPNDLRNSLPDLVRYLCKPSSDPLLHVRSFFVWIANNMRYDFGGISSDPQTVLKTSLSVCEGYANAMKEMCKLAGIKAKKQPALPRVRVILRTA